MKTVLSWLMIILVNVAVLAGILVVIEFGFRYFYNATPAKADQYSIWLAFQPYVMTSNPETHYSKWWNEFSKSFIEADVSSNNYGFTTRSQFQSDEVLPESSQRARRTVHWRVNGVGPWSIA